MKRSCFVFLWLLISTWPFIELTAQVNFTGPELLGRPTDQSITINVVADADLQSYFEYGVVSGIYTDQTSIVISSAGEPLEVVIDGLAADSRYYYRMQYSTDGGSTWTERDEHTFHTQREKGSTFTFTIISDSHLGQYGGATADQQALYEIALNNAAADNPDFHLDLGDTFPMDPSPLGTGMTDEEARAVYLYQRPFLAGICHSVPFFLALGNHENEEGWNFDDTFTPPDQSLALAGLKYRKLFYPNPVPDDFYSGNLDPLPSEIGGDLNHEDYYAWEWGDALFVVLDPYHYSMTWPSEGITYGGEGQDGEVGGDRWDWTLGIEQYLWFKSTLENSHAKYKFVFSHHVTGGNIPYGRGGIEAAPYFEWGGQNSDGTWGFDAERPASEGWDLPIHQLMVENNVDVYFHGHDHIYAMEELDGIVYLECPKPDDDGYTWSPFGYGYTEGHYPNGLMIPNSGHIRVTVSPEELRVEYVRAYLPGDGTNGEIAHAFTIQDEPVQLVTVTSPNGDESWQVGSTHDITWASSGTSGNVHIQLSTDNGANWTDVVASTADIGTYSWTIPDSPSDACLISITDTDGDPVDESDGVFTVSPLSTSHFSPVWTGNGFDHMNFYALSAKIDDVDMQPGDEIGVFDAEVCVGVGILNEVLVEGVNYLEIRVSRDDSGTPEIDGYEPGNQASFKVWDASEGKEISSVNIGYVSGSNLFEMGASTFFNIEGFSHVTQEILLTEGWNVFSLYVIPDNVALMNIVQPLIDEGSFIKVQNEEGGAIESLPGDLGWVDNIGDWSLSKGYKIRVNQNTLLSVTGMPNTETMDIDLQSGWNIMGYPFPASQNAMESLNELITNGYLIKVQDETGAAIEALPGDLGWIDNIGSFSPGEGYKVNVSSNCTLTCASVENAILKSVQKVIDQPSHFQPIWAGNGFDHMNIYLFKVLLDGLALEAGDEIAVFDGNICVGAIVVSSSTGEIISMVASSNDPTTKEVDGFIEGHTLSFKIWDNSKYKEIQDVNAAFFPGYDDIFKNMGTTIADLAAVSPPNIQDEGINTTLYANVYPNPFNEKLNLEFYLPASANITIKISDVSGTILYKANFGKLEAGVIQWTWNGQTDSGGEIMPGYYFIQIMSSDGMYLKVLHIIKT